MADGLGLRRKVRTHSQGKGLAGGLTGPGWGLEKLAD